MKYVLDCGYSSGENLRKLENRDVFMPDREFAQLQAKTTKPEFVLDRTVPVPVREHEDRFDPHQRIQFTFDRDRDCFVCPCQAVLAFKRERALDGVLYRNYHKSGCEKCGALARQGFSTITDIPTGFAFQITLPAQQCQKRVGAQLIMIVEIFVSQAQPIHSLRDKFVDAVLNEPGVTQIKEALRKSPEKLLALFDLTQQKTARVGGDLAAVKGPVDRSAVERLKIQLVRATVCSHRSASPFLGKGFVVKHLYRNGRPFSIISVRNPG